MEGQHAQEVMERTTDLPEKVQSVNTSPAAMLQMAVANDLDLDKVKQLMELQFTWEAEQARKEFFENLARFQEECVQITKDAVNSQFGNRYTTIGNLMTTANPFLGKHGFSARHEIDENGEIVVSCVLTHRSGHSEKVTMSAPSDKLTSNTGNDVRNAIQAKKSTITYLRAVTYEAVTGLAGTSDGSLDDDGNAAGKVLTGDKVKSLRNLIKSTGANEAKFLKVMKVEKLELIPDGKYKDAVNMIKEVEKRRKEAAK